MTGVFTEENRHIIEALKQSPSRDADFTTAPRLMMRVPGSTWPGFRAESTCGGGSRSVFPGILWRIFSWDPFSEIWGNQFADRMLIDEGILECKIAAGLQPDWDAPAVEPGSILVNFGESEAALRELEQAENSLPEPTPHLRFVKGFVLMTLERHSEALACLEAVIEERPDFAPAYDLAAHCAFKSGDRIKGLRYAKEARMRGMYAEHRAWGNGEYSSRRRGLALPSDGL